MIGVVLTFQAVVWLALSYLFMRSRGGSIFHPFTYYLVFHGIVFVVIPALGYIFNFQVAYYYMWFYPTEGQIIFTLWLTMVALLAFALFGWILDPTVPNLDRPTPDGFNAEEWRAYVVLAVALSPLILYSMYKAFGSGLGGEALIQMDRDPLTGIAVNTNTSGYVTDAQNALIPLCLMLIWGTRFRRWSFVPLVAYLALKLYVGWGRWTIILTVAMLGLLVLTHMKKRWVPLYFFVIGLPLFIAFQQLGANRDFFKEVLTGESTAATTTYDRWVDRFDGLDFANFDSVHLRRRHRPRTVGDLLLFHAISPDLHRTDSANSMAGKTFRTADRSGEFECLWKFPRLDRVDRRRWLDQRRLARRGHYLGACRVYHHSSSSMVLARRGNEFQGTRLLHLPAADDPVVSRWWHIDLQIRFRDGRDRVHVARPHLGHPGSVRQAA